MQPKGMRSLAMAIGLTVSRKALDDVLDDFIDTVRAHDVYGVVHKKPTMAMLGLDLAAKQTRRAELRC